MELDLALDALQGQVEHDVAEGVVRALGVDVAARDTELVGEQPLVVVVVGGHDDQPLAQRGDRARILVAKRLVDQDRRPGDVLPVDLVVVDRAERGDQVTQVTRVMASSTIGQHRLGRLVCPHAIWLSVASP